MIAYLIIGLNNYSSHCIYIFYGFNMIVSKTSYFFNKCFAERLNIDLFPFKTVSGQLAGVVEYKTQIMESFFNYFLKSDYSNFWK